MIRPDVQPDRRGRTAPAASRAPQAAAAGVALALLLLAPSFASAWKFEAESVVPDRSYDVGGDPLKVVSCSAASGQQALEGLDEPGDWVEFDLTLATEAVLADSIRCAAVSGGSWQFLVEFYPREGADPVASHQHGDIRGRGIT